MTSVVVMQSLAPLRAEIGLLLFGFFCGAGALLSATATEDLERLLADAVNAALLAAGLSRKVAADIMGIPGATLDQQLACVPHRHLALAKLMRLPFTFWLSFTPTLMLLLAKKRMQEISEDLQLTRKGA